MCLLARILFELSFCNHLNLLPRWYTDTSWFLCEIWRDIDQIWCFSLFPTWLLSVLALLHITAVICIFLLDHCCLIQCEVVVKAGAYSEHRRDGTMTKNGVKGLIFLLILENYLLLMWCVYLYHLIVINLKRDVLASYFYIHMARTANHMCHRPLELGSALEQWCSDFSICIRGPGPNK